MLQLKENTEAQEIYEVIKVAESNLCGLIFVKCKDDFDKNVQQISNSLSISCSGNVHYRVIDHSGILSVILYGKTLSETHYYGLIIKQSLLDKGYYEHQMIVAPVTVENKISIEMIEQMFYQLDNASFDEIVIFHEHFKSNKVRTILVVDGDNTIRQFLVQRYDLQGYNTLEAKDGYQGIQLYKQYKPDLIITDINLSGIDGYQFLTQINKNNVGNQSKVIVLTSRKAENTISACFNLGVSDYITKPFSTIELDARIKRLL